MRRAVAPAKAGVSWRGARMVETSPAEIPAFAGMTTSLS